MGIGRSRIDLEGKPIKKSRSWREIAVEVSRHEKEGSCLVAGDVYADEGREMMCSMTRANNCESEGSSVDDERGGRWEGGSVRGSQS